MAATNIDWVRDPVVDANPDLTRKRQRLSEEPDTSPLSPTDDVMIEEVPMEEDGSSLATAIELHDDLDPLMAPFSDVFLLTNQNDWTTSEQIEWLRSQLAADNVMDPQFFAVLANALGEHISQAQALPDLGLIKYLAEQDFFDKLGEVCYRILARPTLFEEGLENKPGRARVLQDINDFMQGINDMCLNVVKILPAFMESLSARRDSAGTREVPQRNCLLWFIRILAQSLVGYRQGVYGYFKEFGFKPNGSRQEREEQFVGHEGAIGNLVVLLQKLTKYNDRLLDDAWDNQAWEAVSAILHIQNKLQLDDAEHIHAVLSILHRDVLPIICNRKKQALPAGLHGVSISVSEHLLEQLLASADTETVVQIYNKFIRSDGDAVFPERASGRTPVEQLIDLSDGDTDAQRSLMNTAWFLQRRNAMLRSSIMELRNQGMNDMNKRLPEYHKSYRVLSQGLEHPVLIYIVRFLRSNELTQYIFGPNSHASLINYSSDVIGFLAAMSNYTNQETDVIWHACTESVEVEKVKASWCLLTRICGMVDHGRLLYLVEKYAHTAPSKMNEDIVQFLGELIAKMHEKTEDSKEALPTGQDRLKTAFVSIDIMMNVHATTESELSIHLFNSASNELLRYTTSDYSTADRHAIYCRCINSFNDSGQTATAAAKVMNVLLHNVDFTPEESGDLLAMLSVRGAVDELSRFVKASRSSADRGMQRLAITPRLVMILYFVTLTGEAMPADAAQLLFENAFGGMALDNPARDLSWLFLSNLSKGTPRLADVASSVLDHFLSNLAVAVPLKHTTATLVHLLGESLFDPKDNGVSSGDEAAMLDSPVWRRIVDAAESSDDADVRKIAASTIRQLLCCPKVQLPKGMSAGVLQADFTRRQIDRLGKSHVESSAISGHPVYSQLELLYAVLQASREYPVYVKSDATPTICLSSSTLEHDLHFRLQLYRSGHNQPKSFQVQAKSTTTLKELAEILPAHTGTTEHRVILGGKLVDLTRQADESFAAIGLQSSGVMQICPKHTFQSDLNTLMKPVGAVEDTIMAHYDQIEDLLGATEDIASRTFDLLKQIRPPKQARNRVVSSDTSVNKLCPASSTWRTLYTIHVLRTHLLDFASIGVVDCAFFVRGTGILIAVIMDSSRQIVSQVYIQVLDCLVAFLQERSDSTANVEIVQKPDRFVTRVADMCLCAVGEHDSGKTELAGHAYRTLLHVCQQQPTIWESFAADSRMLERHQQLLFNTDLTLFGKIIDMIETFCNGTSNGKPIATVYFKILLGLVQGALATQRRATDFFRLATNILHADTTLLSDETKAREVIRTLVSALWQYRHTESPNFPLTDTAMAGLLQLLAESIQVVRSFKKPLALEGFALNVFSRLLFPPAHDTDWSPLLEEQSRGIAFRLVKMTCESEEDFRGVLLTALDSLQKTGNIDPAQNYPGRDKFLRPASDVSGLPNLRNTCYMNSLLQQLFANTRFRQFIFSVPIESTSQETVLAAVSRLFAQMQDAYSFVLDTNPLARLLDIDVWIQEDVHTFYENFLARLEADMPSAEFKAQLARFYTGNLVSQIKGSCGHISSRLEEFVDIPVVITSQKDLAGSLSTYIQGERMEGQNQYRCSTCAPSSDGRLVDAMKRSCIEDLPDNVTFCLKRFSFEAMFGGDASKENGRFEFPQIIDLGDYTRAVIEDSEAKKEETIFELVGVIVHWGTLTSGHYWSYTLSRNTSSPQSRKWLKLNDSIAETVKGGLEEVQEECFGGGLGFDGKPRQDNAYVLFYQRKTSLEGQVALTSPISDVYTLSPLPARVCLPPSLDEELHRHNSWCQRVAHVFDDDYASFLTWAVDSFSRYAAGGTTPSDTSDSQDEAKTSEKVDESAEFPAGDQLVQVIGAFVTAYLQRVIVCQPLAWKKQGIMTLALKKLVSGDRVVATTILCRVVEEPQWLNRVISHDKRSVRTFSYDLILACLSKLKASDPDGYRHALRHVVNVHATFIQPNMNMAMEADFITFAMDVAILGPEETAFILDEGYYLWTMGLLNLTGDESRRHQFPALWTQLISRPTMVSALYDFVHFMVSMQSDIALAPDKALTDVHEVTDTGVSLHKRELHMLCHGGRGGVSYWMQTSRYATKLEDWRASSPGRLLTLLCKTLPPRATTLLEASLIEFIEKEEDSFVAVLHMVLHYLSCDVPEVQAAPVVNALTRSLVEWEGSEDEFLRRIKDAYDFAPLSVLASTTVWLWNLLFLKKKSTIRARTLRFLEQDVFTGPAISDFDDLDAARAQFAFKLVKEGSNYLKTAYIKEWPRAKSEPTIAAGKIAVQHLHDLCDEAATLRSETKEDGEDPISTKLQIWMDEAPRAFANWERLEQDVLADWSQDDEIDMCAGPRESNELSEDDYYTSEGYSTVGDRNIAGRRHRTEGKGSLDVACTSNERHDHESNDQNEFQLVVLN
ncbi:hypothetical protein DOTSEDRAFT_43946 [Dothistroma septosporum NZE10]|uniref:USP domain-containing protein n=1 Tax=Dothistroma septosporum (strain NZE10 / CBS 128990) TaxID=675120 RepID=N1PQE8_DOTSN|nr:hypothetical protein DOTSEDRAFT_43946 [Dothistroma septosporum NZE10]